MRRDELLFLIFSLPFCKGRVTGATIVDHFKEAEE